MKICSQTFTWVWNFYIKKQRTLNFTIYKSLLKWKTWKTVLSSPSRNTKVILFQECVCISWSWDKSWTAYSTSLAISIQNRLSREIFEQLQQLTKEIVMPFCGKLCTMTTAWVISKSCSMKKFFIWFPTHNKKGEMTML